MVLVGTLVSLPGAGDTSRDIARHRSDSGDVSLKRYSSGLAGYRSRCGVEANEGVATLAVCRTSAERESHPL